MNSPQHKIKRRGLRGGWILVVVIVGAGARVALAQASQFALRFHGTGIGQQDRVRIPIDDNAPGPDASAPCDVGAGDFSIELWLRGSLANNTSANSGGDNESFDLRWITGNIIVDRDIFGGSERDWGVSIAGGFVRFGVGRGDAGGAVENTIEGDVSVLDDAWHHVACVRDAAAGQLRIYVDGNLDYAGSTGVTSADLSYPDSGVPDQATPWGPYIVLAAEKHDAGPAYPSFNGFLDEFRVWNVALSQSQILSRFDRVVAPGTPGLVGYYRFEAGSGTALADDSGAGSPDGLLVAGVPGNGEWVAQSVDAANVAPVSDGPLPPGFVRSTIIATGLMEPTVIEFAPDGRLLVGERDGTIRIHQDGQLLAAPLIDIPANTLNGERGLVGMAIDPDFATNGYLYCYYTTNEPRNRVGRFTVVGNSASLASEFVVWQNPALAADYHHGGTIHFGPDGNLYIATGDQFDSASAQSLASEHGKMLRVRPDGTIPPDNPFLGVPGARPALWAIGLRNPFRWVFDSATGRMLIGNVGGNNDDSSEELNVGVAGANYGWPNQEGPQCFVSDCSAYTYPLWSYQHNDPEYAAGVFQASITAGPVYHGAAFPAAYQGNLFVGDYANRWIRRLVFDGSGGVIADPVFLTAPEAGTIVDMEVGPDGALYYVTIGVAWSGDPDAPGVHRIAYAGAGNVPPVAVAAAIPTQGVEPLTVQFSSAGSFDPDGAPQALSYDWDFGDNNGSTLPNPQHVYSERGMYVATLTVSDGAAQDSAAPIPIMVGNPPTASIDQPPAGTTYRAGDVIAFSGIASDPDDGPLPPSAFSWSVVLVHNDHVHPFLGPLTGVTGGSFQVPSSGHSPADTYYEIQLTVTDSDGLAGSATRAVFPVIAPLSFDTAPSGIPIFLDGDPLATPGTVESIPGFQHSVEAQTTYVLGGSTYTFECWSDGEARVHSFTVPESGLDLTATYSVQGTTEVNVAVPANNRNADWYTPVGQAYANLYDQFGLCCGADGGGQYQVGLEFPLPVPRGASIASATIDVVATADQAGSPSATIRAYDVASAPAFAAGDPTPLTDWAPLSTATAAWNFPPFAAGQPYTSPEVAALVQEIVDRADWAEGNAIGFVLDPGATPPDQWRCIRNFASGQPAILSVSYVVLSGGGCAIPGDVDNDGDVDLADLSQLLTSFGLCVGAPEFDPAADIDGSGCVDLADLSALLTSFGTGL
ncbi:MAG: PQQ-dependent sugar dehydrogenase [Phycisphaerae bacterium]|jgi:glucose/arabinose dehydrogenase/PKD repeat protein